MRKHRINKIFVLFMIAVCTAFGLAGCQINGHVIGLSDYYYENAEKYTAGEAELSGTIENIDINWMVGSVTVLSIESDTVHFSEKSDKELAENTQLHYWLENTTLHIKFCGCGTWDLSELEKDLTIVLPNTLIISNLKVSSLSANVKLSNCAVSQSININTLSGNTEANLVQPLKEFKGSSTSGSFSVSAPTISCFDIDTVSDEVQLSVQKEPDRMNVEIVSGDITLAFPESASFTLNYDTVSGNLISELSYRKSKEKYIFGDGKGEYKMESVSGNVRIIANK